MTVTIERTGHVAVLTMSRPEALNAFNTEQLRALHAAASEVIADTSIRCVILTGEGTRAFAAGADIKEMLNLPPGDERHFGHLGHSIGQAINAAPQPWIAAINGFALGGGCEMALACDIRLASDNAVLGQPEVGLGIIPGWGATQRLTRLVGPGIASELILTGRQVRADEALRLGLINAVYPQDELLPKAHELAAMIAKNGPLAIKHAKQLIATALDTDLTSGLMQEAETFALLFNTSDQKAGMTAFVEKRPAEFAGE